jgi:hypothetical protein
MQPGFTRLLSLCRANHERYNHVGLPGLQTAQLHNDKEQKNRAAQTGAEKILPLL